jgi:hypothetical protein
VRVSKGRLAKIHKALVNSPTLFGLVDPFNQKIVRRDFTAPHITPSLSELTGIVTSKPNGYLTDETVVNFLV